MYTQHKCVNKLLGKTQPLVESCIHGCLDRGLGSWIMSSSITHMKQRGQQHIIYIHEHGSVQMDTHYIYTWDMHVSVSSHIDGIANKSGYV